MRIGQERDSGCVPRTARCCDHRKCTGAGAVCARQALGFVVSRAPAVARRGLHSSQLSPCRARTTRRTVSRLLDKISNLLGWVNWLIGFLPKGEAA